MLLPFSDGLQRSHRYDPELAALADRHYSRQKHGTPQFCPPGRNIVLRDNAAQILFVWVFPMFRLDGQEGYYCSIFRNESTRLSSGIIVECVAWAFKEWGPNRCFTFIDSKKVASVNPGYCFKMAGWKFVGVSKRRQRIILAVEP